MKRNMVWVVLWACLAGAGFRQSVRADVWYSYRSVRPEVREVRFDTDGDMYPETYQDIRVAGLPSAGMAPGAPVIPHRPVTLLVPQGEEVSGVSVEYATWTPLPGTYLLPPEQKTYPLSRPGEIAVQPPDPAVYRLDERVPGVDFSSLKVFWCKGYRLVTFNTFPVRYIPAEGRVLYCDEVRVRVATRRVVDAGAHVRCRGTARDEAWVKRKVDNPELAASYHAERPRFSGRPGERDEAMYVIITTEAMRNDTGPNNFQDLLAFKAARGISGTIKLVSEIYSEYPGVDNQQKIRNFCRDAYENLNTEWILLGGDVALVPTRGCYATAEGHQDSTIPTDMYYGCLDGPWDYTGNGVYGEMGDGEDGGDVDVFAELFVGRAPVETATELHNFVAKTLAYEEGDYQQDWADNALLLGEYLWTDTYGGDYMDELWYGSDACGYTTAGYPDDWDVDHLYERESSWGSSQLIPKLNSDNLVWVNHLGHANSSTVMHLSTSDVDNLHNDIPFIVYSQGCYAGAFDQGDCIAERFSVSAHGAFAVLMNGRYGWGEIGNTDGPSQYFHRQFHDAYFGEGIRELGAMNQDSKEDNVWCLDYKANRWVCYEMNLLGCPQVPIDGIVTTRGTVAFDRHHYGDGDTVRVTVKDVDLNQNPAAVETVDVTVVCGADSEVMTLVETGDSTGVLEGDMVISSGAVVPGNGHLEAADGDQLTVTYIDASDGFGGTNVPVTDTALADYQPPAISDVSVSVIDDTSVSVSWHTSEPATSKVVFDTAAPPSAGTVILPALVEDHAVTLTGLTGCTDYVCYVASSDEAGHEVTEDNGGSYYAFTTRVRIYALMENMDTDPGWTITGGDWAWGQPAGQPSGPKADPTSGYDGDNVYGTNLAGAYQTTSSPYHLVTPALNCPSGSSPRLSFYRWLDVAEGDYDHAALSISTNGTDWTVLYENPPSAFYEYRWTKVTYDLSPYVDGSSPFYVRWSMGPCSSGGAGGWNIDNVEVSYVMPCNVPILMYDTHRIDDAAGNGDGHPNPLETVSMSLSVWNAGIDALNVSGVLATDYPYVTISQPDTTFGDIPSGHTSVTGSPAWVFSLTNQAGDGDELPFTMSWTGDNGSGTVSWKEEVYAPSLVVKDVEISDSGRGDGDGIFDPGETVQLRVSLRNDGRLSAVEIHGVLTCDHPEYIIIDDAESDFPDMDAGAWGACEGDCFTVHSLPDTPDHLTVTFELALESDVHLDEPSFQLDVTTSTFILRQSWRLDDDPGWTTEGQWAWGQPQENDGDPSSGYTGANVYGYNLNGDYANNMSETSLTTQSIDCSGYSDVEVRFMRWLGVESSTYDHATFEVSNDGSTWHEIWGNPSSSMEDTAWIRQSFDISAYADGEPAVYLRWVMGPTDSSVTYCGWNIDDIELWASSSGDFPNLTYAGSDIDDTSGGNGNGIVNSGETIDMTVTAANGGTAATGVYGYLSTTQEHVTISSNYAEFGDIPTGGTGITVSPFTFETDTGIPDQTQIPFTITWFSDQGNGAFNFNVAVSAPALSVYGITVSDPPPNGDGDGVLDPGETAQIEVTLLNGGHEDAVNVRATLSVDHTEWVTVTDSEADFSDIPAGSTGGTAAPHYTVTVAPGVPDPSTILLTLSIEADRYHGESDMEMDITTSSFIRRYIWSMNQDPGWSAADGWQWGQPQGNDGDPSSGYTGANVYGYNLNGDYANNMSETNLTTQPIDCSGYSDVEVRFMRWLGVESSTYDHATFEVSNDGSTWHEIWGNPSSSMEDTAWIRQSFDISAYADGEPAVYLRWVMGPTDSSVTYCGWNIDDVEIWASLGGTTPTATPTSVPPTPTATRTPSPTATPTSIPPTATPTPHLPSPTPTTGFHELPTPTDTPAPDPGMTLYLTDTDIMPGDEFHLYFELYNPLPDEVSWDVYLLLQIGADYWCWPGWNDIREGLDYRRMNLGAGERYIEEVLRFIWPDGVGSGDGLSFIGAAFEMETWNLVGSVRTISWRYRE